MQTKRQWTDSELTVAGVVVRSHDPNRFASGKASRNRCGEGGGPGGSCTGKPVVDVFSDAPYLVSACEEHIASAKNKAATEYYRRQWPQY